jgi:hypothetical protein
MNNESAIESKVRVVSGLLTTLGVLGVVVSVLLGIGACIAHLKGNEPPDVRIVLDLISALGVCGSLALSLGLVFVGRAVRQRRRYTLGLVASVLILPAFPFGTAVGVYSLSVLRDPAVKRLFA